MFRKKDESRIKSMRLFYFDEGENKPLFVKRGFCLLSARILP